MLLVAPESCARPLTWSHSDFNSKTCLTVYQDGNKLKPEVWTYDKPERWMKNETEALLKSKKSFLSSYNMVLVFYSYV